MDLDADLDHAQRVHREGRIDEAAPIYQRILQDEPEYPGVALGL